MLNPTPGEIEGMRPKKVSRITRGKGPKRPRHKKKLEKGHKVKRFTKRLRRQRGI
jgi:hypothetical protein